MWESGATIFSRPFALRAAVTSDLHRRKLTLDYLEALLSTAVERGLAPALRRGGAPTRWHVVTGTYSSGKTTLVRDIARATGLPEHEEPARTFIETRLAPGQAAATVWAHPESLVVPIHQERVRLESSLDVQIEHVLDTAIPDTLAYALLYGSGVDEIIAACGLYSYREPIVFLESLPFVKDDVRHDDASERLAIAYLRARIYSLLGYDEIRIPAVGERERFDRAVRALDLARHMQSKP